jgi:hypothetical protein
MPLEIHCVNPECRAKLKVPDDLAGSSVRCPKCQYVQEIRPAGAAAPAAPEVLDVLPVVGGEEDSARVPADRSRPAPRPPSRRPRLEEEAVQPPERRSNTGLVVGLILGGTGLLLVLMVGGMVAFYLSYTAGVTAPSPTASGTQVFPGGLVVGQPVMPFDGLMPDDGEFQPEIQPQKEEPWKVQPPFAVDPALLEAGTKVYLTNMQEFDVRQGPWTLGKGGRLGDPADRRILIGGQPSPKGLGLHAPDGGGYNRVRYALGKKAAVFKAGVAFNDANEPGPGPVRFQVVGDGKSLWKSAYLLQRGRVLDCVTNVEGVDVLELRVWTEGFNLGSHAVWVEPRVFKDRAEADKEKPDPSLPVEGSKVRRSRP